MLQSSSDPAAERRLNGAVSFGGRPSGPQILESKADLFTFPRHAAAKTAPRRGDAKLEGDEAMSRNVAYAAGEDLQILSFEVGTQTYGVPVGAVREIRGVTPATPLPDAPPYVRGVINLRGQVMPVIDLSERLGKGVAADSARQVIIVVEHHDDVAGLLVDAVCDSFIVPADAISPPPPLGEDAASPLVSAVITTEAAMIVLLAVDAILPERKVAIAA